MVLNFLCKIYIRKLYLWYVIYLFTLHALLYFPIFLLISVHLFSLLKAPVSDSTLLKTPSPLLQQWPCSNLLPSAVTPSYVLEFKGLKKGSKYKREYVWSFKVVSARSIQVKFPWKFHHCIFFNNRIEFHEVYFHILIFLNDGHAVSFF